MFLSTKVILNTRGTFLKKSSCLCTGCRCLPPCDISRIRSNDSNWSKHFILTCRDCSSHYTPGWDSQETGDYTRLDTPQKLSSRTGKEMDWSEFQKYKCQSWPLCSAHLDLDDLCLALRRLGRRRMLLEESGMRSRGLRLSVFGRPCLDHWHGVFGVWDISRDCT